MRTSGTAPNRHARLLHVLISDLLEGPGRAPMRAAQDVIGGLAEYFGFVGCGLTTDVESGTVHRWVSSTGLALDDAQLVDEAVGLFYPPDSTRLLSPLGPGDVWHSMLTQAQADVAGTGTAITSILTTVPYHGDRELSLIALLDGRAEPERSQLEVLHQALSHLSLFLSRSDAERANERSRALDDALASARASLLDATPTAIIDSLVHPVRRIGELFACNEVRLRPIIELRPRERAALVSYAEPTLLNRTDVNETERRWGVTVTTGEEAIGWLSWTLASAHDEVEAADAFARLCKLVPSSAARLDVERRLEAAYHSAPVGIALRDKAGRLVDCNAAFLRFVGAEHASTLHGTRRVDLLDLEHADHDLVRLIAADEDLIGVEVPFAHSSGTTVWGRLHTSIAEASTGTTRLDHVEDITEARRRPVPSASSLASAAATQQEILDTQLANRLHSGQPATLVLVDVDRFTALNEAFGYDAGDALLEALGTRLSSALPDDAQLARASGDEFAIIVPTVSYRRSSQIAEALLESTRFPFSVGATPVNLGVSIGVCIGESPTDASAVKVGAARALQEAKGAGRNRFAHHAPVQQLPGLGLLESELRHAIQQGSLALHYQPEIDLRSEMMVGVEALVRWDHPARGLLGAAEFVPVAEDIGLSSHLMEFVLGRACNQATDWQQRSTHRQASPFMMRVNLSQRDIEQPTVVGKAIETIVASGVSVEGLCLEVTETAVMRDQDTVVRQLHRLADLGVSLAVDDFGTGYSSLWLLRELPFDTLKIDKSFVAALQTGDRANRAIVETIVSLAGTLDMHLTAEGIETVEQLEILRELGVSTGQGFLFAKARTSDEITSSLQRNA